MSEDDFEITDYKISQKALSKFIIPVLSDFCHGLNIQEVAAINGVEETDIKMMLLFLVSGYAKDNGLILKLDAL